MKLFSKPLLKQTLILLLGYFLLASSSYAEDVWRTRAEDLMQKPLKLHWTNNGRKSKINLVGIENQQLIFNMPGQQGEASMPLDSLGDIWFEDDTNSEYGTSVGLLGDERFGQKNLQALRVKAYPRMRFLGIPRSNSGFAVVVGHFIKGLIQLDRLNEASFVIDQIDINRLGPEFEKYAIQLAIRFIEKGRQTEATKIIQSLSIDRIDSSNIYFVIDLAHSLREQKKYGPARSIYKQIDSNLGYTKNEAKFWAYYCGINLDDYIEDRTFSLKITSIEPGEEAFALQQLVLGIYYSKREQTKEAMRAISQGVAFAKPIERWTPELMFRSAEIYQKYEMPEIAQSVFEETILFFPSTKWAEAAQKELN